MLFSSRGQKKESWKNPLIKIRLETKQRITKGESQRERMNLKRAEIGKESKQNNIKYGMASILQIRQPSITSEWIILN